jgi:PST family polysaccharide transporter
MARLLGPAEFGLYAIVAPIVSFLSVIADGGLGLTMSKEKDETKVLWSTAFWLLLATGTTISIVVSLIGYVLSETMAEKKIFDLMIILGIAFPFITLSVLPSARIVRKGDLPVLAASDLLATFLGGLVAVGVAYNGFGAISLALQFLVRFFVRSVILNIYAFELPTLEFSLIKVQSHLSAGGILVAGQLLDLACKSVENFLLGAFYSRSVLGSYNFANQIPRFMAEAFSNSAWGALYSATLRGADKSYIPLYFKLCRFLAFVTFPASALLASAAPGIFFLALGPDWTLAANMVQILAPVYAFSATASIGGAIILAENLNKTYFLLNSIASIGRVICVLLGYWLGLRVTIIILGLLGITTGAIMTFSVAKRLSLSRYHFFGVVSRPALCSFAAFIGCYLAINNMQSSWINCIGSMLLGSVIYLAMCLIIDRRNLIVDIDELKYFFRKH